MFFTLVFLLDQPLLYFLTLGDRRKQKEVFQFQVICTFYQNKPINLFDDLTKAAVGIHIFEWTEE
jgi:hypothetical protein